jgi:Spy/CpxP family protein refolding chaperone
VKRSQEPNTAALEGRLRAASDGIQLISQQLHALEEQKRSVQPNDPRFVQLAGLVRMVAAELLDLASAEEAFASEVNRVGADLERIEQVPPRQHLQEILEEWRAVERQLAAAPPSSAEARALVERFEQLRDEYARASDDKHRAVEGDT